MLSWQKSMWGISHIPSDHRDSGFTEQTDVEFRPGRCTALHGVPTHFLGVLSEVERRQKEGEVVDLGRLRTGIAAGSPIPIDLMKQLIDKMNLTELTVAYGMS